MKSRIPFFCITALVGLPAFAQGDPKAQAESVVNDAVILLQNSGLDRLVHETTHANGRFATKDPSKPQLIVYDLKGKTLAYSGDARHVGMDHSKVIASLLEFAKTRKKGWYEPSVQGNGMRAGTYFERVDEVLITCTIHLH